MFDFKNMRGIFLLLFLALFLKSMGQVVPSDSLIDKTAYRIKKVKLVSRKDAAYGYVDSNLMVHMEKVYLYSADKIVKIEYNYLDSTDFNCNVKLERCYNRRDSLVYCGVDSVLIFQKRDSSGISIVNSVRSINVSRLREVFKQIKEKRRFDFSIQDYHFYCRNGKIRKVNVVRDVLGFNIKMGQLSFFKSLIFRLHRHETDYYKITTVYQKIKYDRNGNVRIKYFGKDGMRFFSRQQWLSKNRLTTCPGHVCDSFVFNSEGYLVYNEHYTDVIGPSDLKYEYEKGKGNYFDLEYDWNSLMQLKPIVY